MSDNKTPLPTGWVKAKLSDVITLIRGVTYEKADARDTPAEGLVPIIRATNISECLGFDELVYVPLKYVSESQMLKAGDVVVVASSGSRRNVGKAALLKHEWYGSFGAFCYAIRPSHGFNDRFLAYFLQTPSYRNRVAALSAGVNINNLKQEHILETEVPVAPVGEQERILSEVEKQFSRLDAAQAGLNRVRANLKRYRASVLKAACEGRLVPAEAKLAQAEERDYEPAEQLIVRVLKERRARWEEEQLARMKKQGREPKNDKWKEKYEEPAAPDVSELPDLPEGWVWARAEQLCDFITKGTTPHASKLHKGAGQVPFIKVYNLTHKGSLNFTINPTFISNETHSGELARSRVFPGDVLMNIVGPPLGKVSVVPDTYSEWNVNQAIAIYRPMPSFNGKYLCVALLTDKILSWAVGQAKATAGQFNLTLEICRDLPLPLPPFAEQERIVAEVERCLSIVEELEVVVDRNLKRADRLRQAILKRAFEGRLVAQDPADEPAELLLERIRAERTSAAMEGTSRGRRGRGQPGFEWPQADGAAKGAAPAAEG